MNFATRFIPALALALLFGCGQKQETASAPATEAPKATSSAAPAGEDAAKLAKGEEVVKKTCALCHLTGAAGAPMIGAKADWEPRIAQGKDTLYEHALKGFTGSKGAMPAKGGNAALADEDVKAAVDYMVSKAK